MATPFAPVLSVGAKIALPCDKVAHSCSNFVALFTFAWCSVTKAMSILCFTSNVNILKRLSGFDEKPLTFKVAHLILPRSGLISIEKKGYNLNACRIVNA